MDKYIANEAGLLQASISGDSSAFEAIVSKYQSLVCSITYSATGNVEKSEELAQETFVRAWKNLKQLRELSSFKAWLCSIAKTTVKNHFRSQKRDVIHHAESIDNAANISSDSDDPVSKAISLEQQTVVAEALKKIPDNYRQPLILFYRQGQSIKQVAELLDLTEENTRSRLHRGRKMLKAQMVTMVEDTLTHTAPGKMFTTAVMASIAGLALKGAATATAAVAISTTGTGITAVLSTVTAKILTAAAVLAIGIGAAVAHKNIKNTNNTQPPIAQTPVTTHQKSTPDNTQQTPIIVSTNLTTIADQKPTNLKEVPSTTVEEVTVNSSEPENPSETEKSTAYKFKPKGLLSGLITDIETGEPIADIRVGLYRKRKRSFYTTTDSNGFYFFDNDLPKEKYSVNAISDEYLQKDKALEDRTVNITEGDNTVRHIVLEKACMVEVYVINEDYEPLEGVRVLINSITNEIGHEYKTDKDGTAVIGAIKKSDTPFLLTITDTKDKTIKSKSGDELRQKTGNYAFSKCIVTLNNPDVIEYRQVVMKKGVAVRGYVEYLDGVPANEVSIRAEPNWWKSIDISMSIPVEPNGFFTLPNITEEHYKIHAFIPMGVGASRGVSIANVKWPLKDEILNVIIQEKSPQSMQSISGKVRYTGGVRPQHVSIRASSVDGSYSGRVKPDDTFDIKVAKQGKYQLTFTDINYRFGLPGGSFEEKIIDGVQAPAQGLDVELIASSSKIPMLTGIVIDSNTKTPIKQFNTRIRKTKHLEGQRFNQRAQTNQFNNTEGKFDIKPSSKAGLYQVQIIAEGFGACWSNEISTDDTDPVVIELTAGGTITGKVVNSKGQPVSDATVIPLSKACGTHIDNKDVFLNEEGAVKTKNGNFTLKDIAGGKETLKVVHPDYAFKIIDGIEVFNGHTADGIEVVLSKGATVQGYVYDDQGRPDNNVLIYLMDTGIGRYDEELGTLGIDITDANGFYRINCLPEMMCYAKRQNEWTSQGVVRRAIFPTDGKTSQLDFGGKPVVSGQMIVNQIPISNRRVLLANGNFPTSAIFKCFDVTDSQGRFNFNGAAPDIYGVYYERSDKKNKWIKAGTVEVTDKGQDIGVLPRHSSKVKVHAELADQSSTWDIKQLYMTQADKMSSGLVGDRKPPTANGDPYTWDNIPPGNYTVVVTRTDGLRLRKQFEVIDKDIEIFIQIPKSKASISGQIQGPQSYITMWKKEKDIVASLAINEDSTFKVEDLPAGEYFIGDNLLAESGAILKIDLGDGEHKTLNIDTSIKPKTAILSVMVCTDDGIPVGGADVWLEKGTEIILPDRFWRLSNIFIAAPGEYTLNATYEPVAQYLPNPTVLGPIAA